MSAVPKRRLRYEWKTGRLLPVAAAVARVEPAPVATLLHLPVTTPVNAVAIAGPGAVVISAKSVEALYRRWYKPVRVWINNRGVESANTDDLAQQVFVKLLEYSEDKLIQNPQGYLFRIAANIVSEWAERAHIRKEHIHVEAMEDPDKFSELIDMVDPEHCADLEMSRAHIAKHVARLPRRRREILLAHINDGKTYQTIADEQGITYRIVLRDLTRTYAYLRTVLHREELEV